MCGLVLHSPGVSTTLKTEQQRLLEFLGASTIIIHGYRMSQTTLVLIIVFVYNILVQECLSGQTNLVVSAITIYVKVMLINSNKIMK